jgi:hypothetical protein
VKKPWLNDERAIGFILATAIYLLVMFIGDIRESMAITTEHNKSIALHDAEIKLLSAMRPQIFEIHTKVDTIDKGLKELRIRRCGGGPKGEIK